MLRRILLAVTLAEFALSSALILKFILKNPIPGSSDLLSANTTTFYTQAVAKSEKVKPGLPVRLKIPKINVDAALEHVGVTPQGEMALPKGLTNAAWYSQGPRPGEMGSSVIDGHFGLKDRTPAVFDNLHTLQRGDKLYVEDEKGATVSFIVRESRRYDPEADASDLFKSNDGSAHLNLITCQGTWDKASKEYSKRLAVFTDKET